MAQPLEGITINPDENNIQSWEVTIRGPVSNLVAIDGVWL